MKTMEHHIELLAPAGSFQGFIGAVNGGADAVYLAGDKFGARAYADNFTTEEIIEALFIAKLFGVKVYLTVNTLLKNRELDELYGYIKPFYDNGLTGVIIQDFGVLQYLKKHFPGLELHASTQMTVTSLEGARYLADYGVKRVVLARELTLDEIKKITDAGIETECFIHGSMCYCYSGQCLFSSLIGGRSGNRGRCAQPCRLPYRTKGKQEEYCLSLKDMCTLEHLPQLIDSGIASFKIEGRMKNPAYAAWVTRIYRKYIECYLANPQAPYKVEKQDLDKLRTLYIRSDLQTGYYHKYQGKSMITPQSPAYSKTDEAFVAQITEDMIAKKPQKGIILEGRFAVGEPCVLTAKTIIDSETIEVCVTGEEVQEALKAPMSEEHIRERLAKTGDSYFYAEVINLILEGNIFLPVKSVNELRRKALDALKDAIRNALNKERCAAEKNASCKKTDRNRKNCGKDAVYVGFAETQEQYHALMKASYIDRIVVPYGWLLDKSRQLKEDFADVDITLFFALPAVCREASFERIHTALEIARSLEIGEGVYVNQIDSLAYVKNNYPELKCMGDINLYAFNNEATDWFDSGRADGFTLPSELNKDELKHLNANGGELILYGRTPLMHTANCIFLTGNDCRKNSENRTGVLKDRKNAEFPYRGYCDEKVCYNTIYNSVATSLHKHGKILQEINPCAYQLRFTTESGMETEEILKLYKSFYDGNITENVTFAYTNGHFMRGVQ